MPIYITAVCDITYGKCYQVRKKSKRGKEGWWQLQTAFSHGIAGRDWKCIWEWFDVYGPLTQDVSKRYKDPPEIRDDGTYAFERLQSMYLRRSAWKHQGRRVKQGATYVQIVEGVELFAYYQTRSIDRGASCPTKQEGNEGMNIHNIAVSIAAKALVKVVYMQRGDKFKANLSDIFEKTSGRKQYIFACNDETVGVGDFVAVPYGPDHNDQTALNESVCIVVAMAETWEISVENSSYIVRHILGKIDIVEYLKHAIVLKGIKAELNKQRNGKVRTEALAVMGYNEASLTALRDKLMLEAPENLPEIPADGALS